MTTKDIAWTAGFYEGEGWIGRVGKNNKYLRISISQKQKWPLEKLQYLFGGAIYKAKNNTGGFFMWTLTNDTTILGFILTIYCFLSPGKKLQAMKALSLDETPMKLVWIQAQIDLELIAIWLGPAEANPLSFLDLD
jgi:hypothetical protein